MSEGLALWSPPSRRVLLTGPDLRRPGGVSATLAAIGPHLTGDVAWLPVGRRARLDALALVRDPARVVRRRATADLLHVNPSLRWRALLRDVALVRAWGGPAVAWVHGWDDVLADAIARSPASREGFRRAFARTHFAALAPTLVGRLSALGVPPTRIHVVPPAWTGAPRPRDPEARTVVFVGRIEPAKGVLALIAACARVGARLVLAGSGSAVGACRRLAGSLGVEIELPGWLDDDARWRLLARATVFALPSYGEGVPVALLEAMAAGVPCVATAVGGIPWLTHDGALARLIARPDVDLLADALAAAIADPGPVALAKDRARAFAAPEIARSLERVWAAALGEG